jgi:TolA-binding protein
VDCEKLDALAMELVYDELDARAAEEARLHLLGCTRCAAMIERLRGGLRAAEALPIEPPPSLLEARILAAASTARPPVPWHRRAARAMTTAGAWAMRPQIAMAAVVVLMVGTSAVLLRRSSPTASSPTKVTDEGTPVATLEPTEGAPAIAGARPTKTDDDRGERGAGDGKGAAERKAAAPQGAADKVADDADEAQALGGPKVESAKKKLKGLAEAEAPPPGEANAAASTAPASYDDAMVAYKASRWADAQRGFEGAAAAGQKPSSAWLYAGRCLRALGDCATAIVRFRKVVDGWPGSADAASAALEGGECARTTGDVTLARTLLAKAKENPTTRARAETDLASLDRANADAAAGGVKATTTVAAPPAKPTDANQH